MSNDHAASSSDSLHRHLPASQFYWAVLDTSCLPRALFPSLHKTHQIERFGLLFESVLPVPIETIHAVYRPFAPGRVLACGMDRERLAAAANGALTLVPDNIHSGLEVDGCPVLANELNLLTGPFEPAFLRQARARWFLQTAAIITVAAGLFMFGAERRAVAARSAAAQTAEELAQACDAVVPENGSHQPTALRLTAELRRLRLTHRPSAPGTTASDAASTLGAVLAHWPPDVAVQTDSLVATGSTVAVHATLRDHAGAQAFQAAFEHIDGWTRDQPQISSVRDGVRVTIQLKKSGGPPA